MSTVDPERKPGIFGPLSTPELLHNRLMDIFQVAAQNNSDILDVNAHPETGEVDVWLYVTGRQWEDEILFLGPDNKPRYIMAAICRSDEFVDMTGLGRDADGHPADIMRVDHMSELAHRTIEVIFDVKDYPGPIYDEEGEIDVCWENGWRVSYDAIDGWDIHFWKGQYPEIAGKPENWVEPTKEEMDYLKLILGHAARKVSGNA